MLKVAKHQDFFLFFQSKLKNMKKKELAEKAGISIATITKMGKDGAVVSSDVLVKICTALECGIDDIMEFIPEDKE